MKVIISIPLISCVLLVLTGCPSPSDYESPENPDINDQPIVEVEDLFVTVSGSRLFSINQFEFGAGNGATYWTEQEATVSDFYDFSVVLNKKSGYSLGGFGVIFSQRDCGTSDFNALTVFINIEGEFCAGLIKNSAFTYIKEWTDTVYLNRGFNQNNIIAVEEISDGQYRILLNGNEVLDLDDPDDPVHNGGGFGYIAVVSPIEFFPSEPVTINFIQIP